MASRKQPSIDPESLSGLDFRSVMAGYLGQIEALRKHREKLEKMAEENPTNSTWTSLILKDIDLETRAFKELREALGIGKVVFVGEDCYLYSAKEKQRVRDRDLSPRQVEYVEDKRLCPLEDLNGLDDREPTASQLIEWGRKYLGQHDRGPSGLRQGSG